MSDPDIEYLKFSPEDIEAFRIQEQIDERIMRSFEIPAWMVDYDPSTMAGRAISRADLIAEHQRAMFERRLLESYARRPGPSMTRPIKKKFWEAWER